MASARGSAISDAIRIDQEVWDEAFATRVPGPRAREARLRREPASAHPGRPGARRSPAPPPQAPRATALPPRRGAAEPTDHPAPRRTVTIKGRGAERHLPWPGETARRRPSRTLHERASFRPDRLAMWAVFLGLLLVLVAAVSSHG